MLRRLCIVFCLLACLAQPCVAAVSPNQARDELRKRLGSLLDQREKLLKAARAARSEAKRLSMEMAAADQRLAALEAEREKTVTRIRGLIPRLAATREALKESEARYARRLRALYLFGPEASAALLASSADFHQAISRSQNLTLVLESEKKDLDQLIRQREELARLGRRLAFRQAQMEDVLVRFKEHRTKLASLSSRQRELSRRLEAENKNLAGNIAAIREGENRLARTFALAPAARPKPKSQQYGVVSARGNLSPPVEGQLVGRAGPGGRGVVLRTHPGAPVRSPWRGKVAYAGPLSGYGRVVVLDHGQRVHTVLARLGSLAVEAGQDLEAGAVVGQVGAHGLLYLEVRKSTRPQNPLLWLRLNP